MKLLRYGEPGKEQPGLLDTDGRIRDLSGEVADIGPQGLTPEALAALAALDVAGLPLADGTPRLGPCVAGMSKIVGIGLNYRDHAAEAGLPIPTEPVIFSKAVSALCGPNDDTVKPRDSVKLDYEVELGIVIGSRARYVDRAQALEHVAGYCIANDVSERAFQIDRSGGQWDKGKGCDSFAPLGPWMVTREEIANVQALEMFLNVNGEPRQRGNTATMIFPVDELVAYVSCFMTLEPGDVIITGTPPGVGMGHKPPRYLEVGDTVHLGIAGLGEQRQTIVAWPG